MPRILKEPEGWRFSSFRKMRLEFVSDTAIGGRKLRLTSLRLERGWQIPSEES